MQYNQRTKYKNFSALVTVYQKDKPLYFKEALDSILNQTTPPSEIIIVQDGPLTEDLESIVNNFKTSCPNLVKIVPIPQNVGTGFAINEGLKNCTFDLVAKVDSDDINFSNRFEQQINIFNKYPDLSVVSSSIVEFQNDNIKDIISYRIVPELHENIVKFARKRSPINHPVVMYKKADIIAAGGYNCLTYGEDYDLVIRMILKGFKFYNISQPLLYFRSNIDTIKKRGGWWYLKLELQLHYKFYKIGFLTLPQFISNISIRTFFRIIPANIRKRAYQKLLRKKTLQK